MSFLARLTKKEEPKKELAKKEDKKEDKKEVKKELPKKELTPQDKKSKTIKHNFDVFIERPKLNIFIKIFYILSKNMRLLVRSKLSALIFFFGPLLLVFLVALAFNTSTLYDLNVATYSESYSELADSIIDDLVESQYNVLKFDSQEECIDAVKSGSFQVCLKFPSTMVVDNSANNIIQIFVDNSRLNIAYLISSQVSTRVSVEASELSEDLVTDILTVLDTTNTEVVQSKSLLDSLISDNSKLKSSSSSISSDLTSVDIAYSVYDSSVIDASISSLHSTYNISSSSTAAIESDINTLESYYSSATSTLDTLATAIYSSTSSISSVSSGLTSQSSDLDELSTNLGVISEGISSLTITNVENIVTPITTDIEPISSNNSYLFYIIPTLLVILIMFVTLLMSSSNIIEEKTSRAYFRNFITPTNFLFFMIGEFISNFIVLVLQSSIIMLILFYFFNELGYQLFLFAGGVLILIGSFYILLGMLIGYLFNTKQSVTLATVSAALIMLFFSNTILPLETLSSFTRQIVMFNPFIIGEGLLKKIFLFNSSFADIAVQFYILVGFCILTLILAIIAKYISKKYINSM